MQINYSDEDVKKGIKSIFLAGPTPRDGNVISWRIEACKILEKLGFDGIVYVPEYSTWKPKENYIDQAMGKKCFKRSNCYSILDTKTSTRYASIYY